MKTTTLSGLVNKVRATKTATCRAFSSREAFIKALEVKDTSDQGQDYQNADRRWINEDLEPTPPEKRTWGFINYCIFYFGVSFGNWNLGSTISTVAMAFNSRCASVYHLGYPAVCRSVFGLWGSFYFVGARAALAAIWYGVQLYTGASYLANMLRAIFGDAYTDIPNHLPASAGITSSRMLAFFIFWLIHFILCFYRPYQLRKFFWFKGIIMFPAVFGLFLFCMINTGGRVGGGLATATTGGGMGWFFMHAINSGMGNTANLITNQPDIARWSKTKTASLWSTFLTQPLSVTLSATFGILSTAAVNNVWGLELWNPWDLLDAIMDRYWFPGARFAIFLCAFTWMINVLGTNIACNMIAFGADVALLWPRFIDMKRGFFIVEFLGFAVVPWKILSSAAVFTDFLSGYGLFMASVVAIMVSEYFLLTKGNVFISYLYDPRRSNEHYWYDRGWNLQALLAYLIGIALPFPGFVASLGAKGVSNAGKDLYNMGWLLSFVVSLLCYPIICYFWPTRNQKIIKEKGMTWEEEARMKEVDEGVPPLPDISDGAAEEKKAGETRAVALAV